MVRRRAEDLYGRWGRAGHARGINSASGTSAWLIAIMAVPWTPSPTPPSEVQASRPTFCGSSLQQGRGEAIERVDQTLAKRGLLIRLQRPLLAVLHVLAELGL